MTQMAWIDALRAECERTSQARAAKRLGISTSMVSQVLRGLYKADTTQLEERIRGELMAETVTCPVLGEITKRACQDHQRRPLVVINRLRVDIYRACREGCPNSSLKEKR